MATEHERLLRGLLTRKDDRPELTEAELVAGPVGAYHPRAVEISIANWKQRMAHEHRSAQTFANLLPHLIEAEAPLDFKTVVLRSAMDELRHAALCGQVVELLGGDPTVEVDLSPEPPTVHVDAPPAEQALRNLVFVGCISETIAVGLLTEERDLAEEPFVRRALTQLLADETLHARVGWAYLAHTWPTLDATSRVRTTEYVGRALGYYERCIVAATVPGVFDDAILADAKRLGFSEPRNAKQLAYQAIEEVVIPELSVIGVHIGPRWRERLSPP